KIETEDGSEKNAKVIEEAILDSPFPVILLTHSKGGMDALTALVNNSSLIDRVKGVIAIQSPYLGTPVADYLEQTKPWNFMAHAILAIMGGSGESLKDLSTERRVPWYQAHSDVIAQIQSKIPILSFSTWKKAMPGKQDSMYKFTRDLMEE